MRSAGGKRTHICNVKIIESGNFPLFQEDKGQSVPLGIGGKQRPLNLRWVIPISLRYILPLCAICRMTYIPLLNICSEGFFFLFLSVLCLWRKKGTQIEGKKFLPCLSFPSSHLLSFSVVILFRYYTSPILCMTDLKRLGSSGISRSM